MTKKVFNVEGMSCDHCVKAVQMELKELELSSFEVTIGRVEVEYDPTLVSDEKIINAIEEAGYKIKI